MIRLLCCLLFLRGALGAATSSSNGVNLMGSKGEGNNVVTKSFTVETGASQGKLELLNDFPPPGACTVFIDAVLGNDGKIGYWVFYSQGPGDICFGIFNRKRTKMGKVLYESAGKNCMRIDDKNPGYKEVEIPPIQQLAATPTSVVAVHYQSNNVPEYDRVVTVESNNRPRKFPGLMLGKVMVIPETDIRAGQYFQEDPYYVFQNGAAVLYEAIPSFKAIVVGMSKVLDLRNGDNARSGVAMIFMNNVWGTMCDRWYHDKGWPYLFCAEKDFPDTEQIFYTDTPERFQVPANTPIHLKNPRCKFSQNVTMFSCATHDNVTCNHTNDLYIRCKSRVELRKGANSYEGICYVYESNYWGSICDARGLTLHSHHWAHVCCRERGFINGARALTYAKERMPVTSQSVGTPDPISMHSPDCMGGMHGDNIKMCKDGPLEFRCSHDQDVYVECQL